MAALGIGPPTTWDWVFMRGQVIARGAYRLDHVERRHLARASEEAREHGLLVRHVAGEVVELLPLPARAPRQSWRGSRL